MPTVAAVNTVTAPDVVGPTSTLQFLFLLDFIVVDVNNQGIYRQLYESSVGSPPDPRKAAWSEITYQAPGSKQIRRAGLCGIRFWAAIPAAQLPAGASQAVVTIEAVQ